MPPEGRTLTRTRGCLVCAKWMEGGGGETGAGAGPGARGANSACGGRQRRAGASHNIQWPGTGREIGGYVGVDAAAGLRAVAVAGLAPHRMGQPRGVMNSPSAKCPNALRSHSCLVCACYRSPLVAHAMPAGPHSADSKGNRGAQQQLPAPTGLRCNAAVIIFPLHADRGSSSKCRARILRRSRQIVRHLSGSRPASLVRLLRPAPPPSLAIGHVPPLPLHHRHHTTWHGIIHQDPSL